MNAQLRRGQERVDRRRSAIAILLALSVAAVAWTTSAPSMAQTEPVRTVGGLSVYLGVLPSAMIQHQLKTGAGTTYHGGPPPGEHAYHVTVAVFDAASGERVKDLSVRARVSGVGLSGLEKTLHPMTIADTVTYGNYFIMPANDTYRVQVEIRRPGAAVPVRTEFAYDHRWR